VSLFASADALVDTAFSLSIDPITISGTVGWTHCSVDVTSASLGYEGQTLTLVADSFI